jgi:hypothetical protein
MAWGVRGKSEHHGRHQEPRQERASWAASRTGARASIMGGIKNRGKSEHHGRHEEPSKSGHHERASRKFDTITEISAFEIISSFFCFLKENVNKM